MKLNDVYNKWLSVKRRQVKESTLSCYQLIYIKILAPRFGSTDVETMNKKVVTTFLYELLDSGTKSKKYCSDILIVIKMLIRYAGDELDINVPDTAWKVIWPTNNKVGVSKLERYTQEEYRKIVEYVMDNPSPRNLGILLTICTGMRIGEICALQWRDIDLERATINVHQKLVMKGKPHILQGGKSKNSIRTVNIPTILVDFLKNQKTHSGQDYVSLTASGKLFSDTAWRRLWESYLCELNFRYGDFSDYKNRPKSKFDPHGTPFVIEKFTAHYLRHTFATNLFFCGQDLLYVQQQLGHAKPETTLNIYTHLVQTNQIHKTDKVIDFNAYISAITNAKNKLAK